MFDLTAVRAGLAAQLTSLAAAEGLQVTPYMLNEPTPPFVDIFPDEIEYDVASRRGGDMNMIVVRASVGFVSDQGAQVKLDRLLASSGASSMKAALETKASGQGTVTLSNIVDDLRVVSCSGYRVFERPGGRSVLAATWSLQIESSN